MPRKEASQPNEPFSFSEHEQLFDHISDTRLQALLANPHTEVLSAEISSNSYGEFLFLKTRLHPDHTLEHTLFGYGFHEHRDRWLIDEWFFYSAPPLSKKSETPLNTDEVFELLAQRKAEVSANAHSHRQTRRGQLFDMIADLTDDDGALSDFDDFEQLLDDLDDF